MHQTITLKKSVYRLVPSKFPPILLFDWAESKEELEQIAALEGLTNNRLKTELGEINLIPKAEWIGGHGSTPVMAAFTHIGYPSRFTDGTFGIFYAADSIHTALQETAYHRAVFYHASNEAPCSISMRTYITNIKKPLIELNTETDKNYLNPNSYTQSQALGLKLRNNKAWGLYYPSCRDSSGHCVAILRPKAIAVPVTQGAHYRYVWNGEAIESIYQENKVLTLAEI